MEISPALIAFQTRCRDFARTTVAPRAEALDAAPAHQFPWDIVEAGGKAGMLDVMAPIEYGGLGFGVLGYCLLLEELAAADAGVATIFAAHGLGLAPLMFSCDIDAYDRFFPEFTGIGRTGRPNLLAFGLTEPELGTDAQYQLEGRPNPIRTVARRVDGGYLLDGVKKFISNGSAATHVVVFATLDPRGSFDETVCLMTPTASPGFEVLKIEEKAGQRACPAAELRFRDVFVPAANRIGPEGIGWKLGVWATIAGRGGVAAIAVGIAQRAYEVALDWAKRREQGGQPIILHQAVRTLLADMRTQVEAARLMARAACLTIDRESPPPTAWTAMAKTFASDVAMKVTVDAIQVMGGRGYMRDQPLERLMRDAKLTQIYEGTNQLLRLVAMQDEVEAMLRSRTGTEGAAATAGRPALART